MRLPVQPSLNVRRTVGRHSYSARNWGSAGLSRASTNARFWVTFQKRVPQGHATDGTSQ